MKGVEHFGRGTEKELSADRRNLEKIVRDFNDAMKNLGMSERWGTGELVPNSKKKKNIK